ncbi:hypothetical protein RJ639_029035 [Escallonia herrerae]|uniref:KIB1-4 beta-propeller domain-containing protein n=1 Tax=Escallonia herrerae TaxID=1293975 RepID=A0AA89BEE7_9ASTE|nr:hypothetical protein RJ639_029035 [Escallonia herrerae]
MSDGDVNFFYNPFTRAKVELPDLPQGYNRFRVMTFTAPPTSSDCAVFGVNPLFDEIVCISTIVRGEGSWNVYIFHNNVPMFPSPCNPVFCNGLLYCLGRDGKLGVFDGEEGKWTVLEKPEKAPFDSVYENFLMKCEEDIMSFFVGKEGFKRGARISVLRLDRLKMEWQEIKELGDKMLFLSDSTCLSATSHIPGMENKIYFPKLPRLHGRYGVFYSLATNILRSRCDVKLLSQEPSSLRRCILAYSGGVSLAAIISFSCGLLTPSIAWAGDESTNDQGYKGEGVIEAVKSLFDPNEKTKSGKVLPKAYLSSARELVKTLRESLKENPKDNPKFRRNADAAKESIREYLGGWRGKQTMGESYVMIEKAIRSLASFYSKAGPSAPLPDEVKSEILNELNRAEEYL